MSAATTAAAEPLSVLPSPSIQLARAMPAIDVNQIRGMTALELFQAQLASPSAEAHTDALKRLVVVAVSIGKERCLTELVPLLVELGTNNNNSNNGFVGSNNILSAFNNSLLSRAAIGEPLPFPLTATPTLLPFTPSSLQHEPQV